MRILVLGAGGPAGVNTCRALIAAGHDVFAADDNPAHLLWCEQAGAAACDPVDAPDVDVVLPQPDALVRWAAAERDLLPAVFLPDLQVIERCQQKELAVACWHDADLRGPAVEIREPYPDLLHLAAELFGLPFWLRANRGAGANKAIRVGQLGEAFHWIRFWETRGVPVDWIAEQFLPGRDLAWTSIWFHGMCVASFLRERLEYLYPHLTPEGLTGTPTIARIIHDQDPAVVANAAVRTVDPYPHGIYSVDLRETGDGQPVPTEINAGRGFTTMGLWSLYGPNLTDLAARCAVDDVIESCGWDVYPAGLTLSRHIDCGHVFTGAAVLC